MADDFNKHEEEMEEAYDIIVLNDDEGNEHEFMHLESWRLTAIPIMFYSPLMRPMTR
jgi:hypothetical protein